MDALKPGIEETSERTRKMAEIIDRFTTIIKANINDLLDKAEDPAKMVDQYTRDLTESLAEVKESTAAVMAEEARCKRLLDNNKEEIEKYENLAKKALTAGSEDDARKFLAKKQELENKGVGLAVSYDTAKENADKMRQMHDKLVSDLETLRQRSEVVKAKTAVANTQKKVNEVSAGSDKATGVMTAFDRMEAKADEMLDRAKAEETLAQAPKSEVEELGKKYEEMGMDASVEDDLSRLKKEMGLE